MKYLMEYLSLEILQGLYIPMKKETILSTRTSLTCTELTTEC